MSKGNYTVYIQLNYIIYIILNDRILGNSACAKCQLSHMYRHRTITSYTFNRKIQQSFVKMHLHPHPHPQIGK